MKKFFCFFAALLLAGSMMATEVTITASDFTETSSADYSTTKGGVTVAVTASTVTADQMRIFKNQSITISAASNITSIVFTCTANGTAKYGPGCFAAQTGYTYEASGNTGTWVGSATSVSFTASSNQVRATQIVVTIEGGASGDTTSQDTTPVVPPVQMETLLFNANIWNVADVNEKYAAWIWGDSLEGQWTDFFTPVDAENTYGVQIPVTADSIVFVRLDNAIDTVTWNNIWNQTLDYAINHADLYFTVEGWGEGENAKSYGTWGTPVVYNTCADVNAVTANTNMTLNEVTVVFIKGSNIYVKDATGTTLVYTNNYSDLVPGDRVSGIAGQAKLYNGLPELAASTAFADLTVVPGDAPVIFDAQAAPTAANVNEVMMFRGVQMPTASFTTARATNITGTFAGEQVAFRNNWKEAFDFDSTKTYTMLGCVAIYNGNIQVYVTNIEEEVAPVQNYYIKNNWDGGDWTWQEMNMVMNNVIYEYTGVFGGSGVNINTAASDEGSTWFSVENFSVLDSTYVPQALDTIHFVYSIVDSVLAVELVGRPAPAPVQYYIKNNWNGAADWTWVEMNMIIDNVLYEYTGVFGGSGVNINTVAEDNGSTWFSVENFSVLDSTYVPQASDTIHFVYSIVDSVLAVELVGRPAPVPEVFQIKNNWNGGEWTWVDMTPVEGQENIYEYTGVFGGTGVNITSNYMNGELWFPVDSFLVNEGDLVPQAMDTVLFAYNSALNEVAAMVLGRPEPVVLDSVSVVLNITDLTGWATLNVYAWGGAEIFGAWPGMIVPENGIITIEGAYAGMTENLIFNNGQGTQLADLAIAMVDTTYEIIVRLDGAYFADQLPTTNTCAEVNAITENTNMVLGEVSVVFVKGAYVYVEDATATTLVYTNWYGDLKPGDRVQGIAGTAKLYNGLPELVPATPFADLVVTEGEARAIKDATAAPTTADINKVLMFRNVAMPTASYAQGSASNITGVFEGEDVIFRNGWKEAYDFDSTKTYTMLGCVGIYNGTIQVLVTNFEEYVPVEVNYYIKNNWNRASDWTWMDMIPADDGNLTWMYTGIFGGTGVNINTAATDENALWFPIDSMIIPEGNEAPEAGDSVMFVYSTVDKTVTATVLSQVIPGKDITVTVWVRNENTNWEHLYVYGWGGAEEIFGAWPGMQLDVDYVLEADKFEYTNMFHITGDFEGLEENLIFNNGQGGEGNQFPDLKILLTEDAEYFIVIDNEKAYFEGGEGLEEVVSNAKNETTKVIMNGQLYIIRDGKVYNALGAQVR